MVGRITDTGDGMNVDDKIYVEHAVELCRGNRGKDRGAS